jgi:phosphoglucomutase
MYKKYGVFYQTLYSFTFDGESGMKRMNEIMNDLRENPLTSIGGLKVERFEDYKKGTAKDIATGAVTELTLPKSNVLAFYLEGGCKAIVRPSGTEPKIKTYLTAKAPTREEADVIEKKLYNDFTQSMK